MLAVAAWPAAANPAPLTVAAVCAASDEAAVNTLLDGVAADDLTGDLAPLAVLVDADADGALTLKADTTISAVHTALACVAAPDPSADPDPSTTAPSPPSATTEPTTPTSTAPLPSNADLSDLDCDEFATRQDAQEALDAGQGDPNRLDGDSDGLACETGGQVQVIPEGAVDTGGWPAE
ncbi:MAG: hypothetical protein AB7G23_20230 [Vicinamibacterales bacterium]